MALSKVGLVDVNGTELVLDADADTSITVDTDDQIDLKAGGTDTMHVVNGDVRVGTPTSFGPMDNGLKVKGDITLGDFAADSGATTLCFIKSRNTTVGSQTIVSNGDEVGAISFRADDGDDSSYNNNAARIACQIDAAPGTNDMPGNILFETTADGARTTTERMRIDSTGTVLVGKTASNLGTAGVELIGGDNDRINITRDGGPSLNLNRLSSDGSILQFFKAGTEGGRIGIGDTDLFIGKTDGGVQCYLRFAFSNDKIIPCTDAGATNDNSIDLGDGSSRFDDIHATNGTIQTSDETEKQSIKLLTTTEIAVAKKISKLFKTFKFNSAVEKKGDSARTHTGIIAQNVQQAFTDEGLDSGNYGMFISSTWWEKEISVDAVAEQLDEHGNVIVEGKDAHTYTHTKDKATTGYTKKTRLGIRYPELLSFVSSAFEQRLTDIETRLTTLEG